MLRGMFTVGRCWHPGEQRSAGQKPGKEDVTWLLCIRSDALALEVSCRFWTLEVALVFIVSYAERSCGARLSDCRPQEHFCPLSLAGLICCARAADLPAVL